jgi:NAD(P)-dependent dehydrogenase (short-subunit alcohol dehydrogenase family)
MKLADRRILITGASSGIGLTTARLFESEGARLALVALDDGRLKPAMAQLADPDRHIAIGADVTDQAKVCEMVAKATDALGGIDGLVNSAGADLVCPFEDTTLDQWQSIIGANMTSAFLVCQAVLGALRAAGGGTIVNLGSGAALLPVRGRAAYCAAKAGLVMFSKTLALELATENIRVNALCPGAIDTPMLRESAGGELGDPVPKEVISRFALGRIGTTREIANAALFLSSHDSSFITGIALAADGGRTFH